MGTGCHQITGKSSAEIYRQCLLAGCRCVELDFWNGRFDEPIVVHGYTFVPDISAKEALEAIAESAFKTSEFPVILSFENHCNPRQQERIAEYCREIFGDMLLSEPLDAYPLETGCNLPPPSALRRKIIIKNKKKNPDKKKAQETPKVETQAPDDAGNGDLPRPTPLLARQSSTESHRHHDDDENGWQRNLFETKEKGLKAKIRGLSPSFFRLFRKNEIKYVEIKLVEGDDSSSAGEDVPAEEVKPPKGAVVLAEKLAQKAKETEAAAEISALVNYVQPVHFVSFEAAEKKNRFYEMSSFDEKQATTLLKERPVEFVNYNKRQLSRIYPSGKRFDSSNFMPQIFWNAGCQLVALNYQTLDLAMQLNIGMFEYNARCGYRLKPEFMRRKDRRLDPFAESTVDGIIAGTVSIQVLSGQFLSDKRVGTYVEVDMYGLPADTVRRKFRTKVVTNNGINPQYNEEAFVFKKVVLPELASIRITAYEENGKFIGHRLLPVTGLCPGYRHVSLKTESGQPLPLATLFLLVAVKDYVPDDLSDFAEALANPIKYQSDLEKRAQQLSVLTDEYDFFAAAERFVIHYGDHASSKSASKRHQSGCHDLGMGPSSMISSMHNAPLSQRTAAGPSEMLADHPRDSDGENAEPLEKFMESKIVREKKQDLEKKLEGLKKKQEKERQKVRASSDGEKPKSRFYTNKLMKRFSSRNIDLGLSTHEASGSSETEDGKRGSLPSTHSEKLLTLHKEHVNQERELREKYHDSIFNAVEKLMKTSQANQMKSLHRRLEKETAEVMKDLQRMRRKEVKRLSKIHKDRDELLRIKREVDTVMIERGVQERIRLSELYDMKKDDLEKKHDEVKRKVAEARLMDKAAIIQECELKLGGAEEEQQPHTSSQSEVHL